MASPQIGKRSVGRRQRTQNRKQHAGEDGGSEQMGEQAERAAWSAQAANRARAEPNSRTPAISAVRLESMTAVEARWP